MRSFIYSFEESDIQMRVQAHKSMSFFFLEIFAEHVIFLSSSIFSSHKVVELSLALALLYAKSVLITFKKIL
jgi:hypothetical protein